MAWEFSVSFWLVIAFSAGGLATLAIARPWRFFQARTECPQCKHVLPRWDCWGWRETWVCPRCGCRIGG
jgi:hypothetical protein